MHKYTNPIAERWNAHTPKFLHNRTKENFIFQLTLTVLFFIGLYGKDAWDEHRRRKLNAKHGTSTFKVV